MKKKILATILCAGLIATMLAGCGKKDGDTGAESISEIAQPIHTETEDTNTTTEEPEPEPEPAEPAVKILRNEDAPEGYVYNELSGLLIDKSIENQRPIGVMVDNEITALDHYGLNDADVIYEMMNSTANNRITRLFVLMKDWGKVERLGSIRSTRTTNCILTIEWNNILLHDGGPGVFINDYIALDSVDNISGVFARIDNGKPREFTEYVTKADLEKYLVNSSTIDTEYNKYYTGPHFEFTESDALTAGTFASEKDAKGVIALPFPHNSSELHYNADTNLYEYYEYGKPHVDGATGEVLTFRNVILQRATFGEWGEGYMWYNLVDNDSGDPQEGYYITDGKCVPITWSKPATLVENTRFMDENGNNIILNAGKTYIGIVPSDTWDTISIE